jgi:hypothetical protein
MSTLLICVEAWFALNAAVFVVLLLRPDRLDNDHRGLRPSPIRVRNSRQKCG